MTAMITNDVLAVEFANTQRMSRGTPVELLASPVAVTTWVGDMLHRDLTGLVGPDEVARFRALRDAVRAIATAISDGEPDPAAPVADLNAAAAAAPVWPVLKDRTVHEETAADPVDAALAALARAAIELFGGEHRDQVHACGRRPACVRFFLKTHPRRDYCSPECGNRARVSRHYHRTVEGARGAD